MLGLTHRSLASTDGETVRMEDVGEVLDQIGETEDAFMLYLQVEFASSGDLMTGYEADFPTGDLPLEKLLFCRKSSRGKQL